MNFGKPNNKKNPTITIANQIYLCQWRIFLPSKLPKGIKLNNPNQAFTRNPIDNIGIEKLNPKKIIAKQKFVNGPAKLIIPFSLNVILPEIITAPGAAKIKPITAAKPSAK